MKINKELKIGLPNYSNITIGVDGAESLYDADKIIFDELTAKKVEICSIIGEERWKKYVKLFER